MAEYQHQVMNKKFDLYYSSCVGERHSFETRELFNENVF